MDPKIDRIVTPDAFALRSLSDRKRERRFVLPRRGDGDESKDGAEREKDEDVVIEPRPRQGDPAATVSRKQLADEAGQRIDVQG